MLWSLFWSLAGLVGAGGGVFITSLFVPSVALVLKSVLDFARSPLGMCLAVMALGLFLFSSGWVGGDIHGTSAVQAEWRAANLAAAKARAANELAIRFEMKREADKALADLDAEMKSLAEKVRKHESEVPDVAACRADDAGIRRLFQIR